MRVSFTGFGEGGLEAIGSGTHSMDGGVVFHALKNVLFPVRVAWQRLVRHIPAPADEARDLTILVIYFRPLGDVNDAEIEKNRFLQGLSLDFPLFLIMIHLAYPQIAVRSLLGQRRVRCQ
jgi:hypothetical protein